MRIVTHGATDQSIELFIVDSDGLPATGLAYNSSGIDLWYRREGAAVTSITEATQTASGAHSDGGFVHIANGVYRLDPPDAAFAAGVTHVAFGGTITGYTVYPVTVQLVAVNLQDSVRAGLTSLPNAAAEAAGGLYTRGTGAGQINQSNNGQIDANAARTGGTTNTGRDIGASVLLSPGTGTGQVNLSSGAVPVTGDLTSTMKASVNTEVLDVLSVDTFGEPSGTPGATLTLREKIGWLFMALRNGLTVTATKKTFLDDSGSGEWAKNLADDGTTYTESEATTP